DLGDGRDRIMDGGGNDTLFLRGYDVSELLFGQDGDDLKLFGGGTDEITIEGGLVSSGVIEHIRLEDGHFITSVGVNQLLEAMGTFAADRGISLDNAADIRENSSLVSLTVSAWQS
ncbi:MAG: hypothetical protein MI749_15040, partial [Desulfovibrionales bacterium]|nr:hypothetical protein [Desulfovibrionales bacterium]